MPIAGPDRGGDWTCHGDFLFAKARKLMLTQGGPDGTGQVDISPYLLTFIAFVSGFMAEDAFARIKFAGQKLFRVADD
ncbi:MAG: hypothetical protein VX620_07905 [Pseudomonadota bacterium]|nr:hypothetical protein [Pseudomonadota bacterium]